VDLSSSAAPNLTISPEQTINALARAGQVQIDLSLSQLISDSPSELAFIVGHELGHVAQLRHAKNLVLANAEQDADLFAMTLMITAGFDPYAGAGALAKLNMVSGQVGLLSPAFDDLADPHASFSARIDLMFSTLSQACAQPAAAGLCGAYKPVIHPNFPATAPLSVTPPAGSSPQGATH
jgi:predicted Zn-dependent protease